MQTNIRFRRHWVISTIVIYYSIRICESSCLSPFTGRSGGNYFAKENKASVNLLTFTVQDDMWTLGLRNSSSYSPAMAQSLNRSVGFRGEPSRSECDGPRCTVTLLTAIDLENLRDSFGFNSTSIFWFNLTCNNNYGYILTLTITSVNEFSPYLLPSPLRVKVEENTPVGNSVVVLARNAIERDAGEWINFFAIEDPTSLFHIKDGAARGVGNVTVKRELDFESLQPGQEVINITVTLRDSRGKSGNDTLLITILDMDDQPPVFQGLGCSSGEACEQIYTVSVTADQTGILTDIQPSSIRAVDGDSLGSHIMYSFQSGPAEPSFREYFFIDTFTGDISILHILEDFEPSTNITLYILATEESEARRNSTIMLVVSITEGGIFFRLNMELYLGLVVGIGVLVLALLVMIVLLYGKSRMNRQKVNQIHQTQVKRQACSATGAQEMSTVPNPTSSEYLSDVQYSSVAFSSHMSEMGSTAENNQ